MTRKTTSPFAYVGSAAEHRAVLRRLLDTFDKDARSRRRKLPVLERWQALADEVGVSVFTIDMWGRKGIVPNSSAIHLIARYGHLVPKLTAADLSKGFGEA